MIATRGEPRAYEPKSTVATWRRIHDVGRRSPRQRERKKGVIRSMAGCESRRVLAFARAYRPGLVGSLLVIVVLALGWSGRATARIVGDSPDVPARPAVLLIGIDTMRADHLGCIARNGIQTPHLDALAHDGVLFTAAHSAAPWTLPSFATVFTGLWPSHHGAVGGLRSWLESRFTTMAEYFLTAGYAVEGVAGVDWLTRACNMDQGFQPDDGPSPPLGLDRASLQTWLATSFCERMRDRPFFFFLHYFDVHAPYAPPAPFDRMYYTGDPYAPGEPITTMLRSPRNRAVNRDGEMYDFLDGVTDLDFPRKQYAAEVSYVDDKIGQLVASLKRAGIYDDMMIVVLADHGEHLGEHDLWFTHALPYEETLHVPLIIKLPRSRCHGTVVDQPVSLVDVLPTVLAEARLTPSTHLDGQDLHPLMAGGRRGHSILGAQQGSDPHHGSRSLQLGRWKLIEFVDGDDHHDELYDLVADPGELHPVKDKPDVVQRLHGRMESVWGSWTASAPGSGPQLPALDQRVKNRLRSLGY